MAKGIIDNNGNKIEFEPPTPTVDKRGGIFAKSVEDTTDMTEVVVGADGKGYVEKVDLSGYVPKTRKILGSNLDNDLDWRAFMPLASDTTFTTSLISKSNGQIKAIAESSENLAKKEYVDALIEAITTIDIKVVEILPTEGISSTTIYLIPKQSAEDGDIYDEYIYVNENWEHIGNTQADLSNYVKNTDYATNDGKAGIVKVNNGMYGVKNVDANIIGTNRATDAEIEALSNGFKPIVPSNLKKAVETIGGNLEQLDTTDKSSYVGAINEMQTALSDKADKNEFLNYVQKEDGKGLSSNDYTNEEKEKLNSLKNYGWRLLYTYTANQEEPNGGFELTKLNNEKITEALFVFTIRTDAIGSGVLAGSRYVNFVTAANYKSIRVGLNSNLYLKGYIKMEKISDYMYIYKYSVYKAEDQASAVQNYSSSDGFIIMKDKDNTGIYSNYYSTLSFTVGSGAKFTSGNVYLYVR